MLARSDAVKSGFWETRCWPVLPLTTVLFSLDLDQIGERRRNEIPREGFSGAMGKGKGSIGGLTMAHHIALDTKARFLLLTFTLLHVFGLDAQA